MHPQWMNRPERNWDIAVSYYGNLPNAYEGQYDWIHRFKGSKWEGLSDFLRVHPETFTKYDYVWLPDDDILTTSENIDQFFSICRELDFTIAQPALTRYSYSSWKITLKRPNSLARITNFVEVMAPCFKVDHFKIFSDTFSINTSGWGYEWLWHKLAEQHHINRLAIIDRTPVFHTRPVGSAGHGGSKSAPISEKTRLLEEFQLTPHKPRVHEFLSDNSSVADRGMAILEDLASRLLYRQLNSRSDSNARR